MLYYAVIHSLLTWHDIVVCALLFVCQLGWDKNHNTRFQQKACKPWSPHCMLFGEAVLIFVSQLAWAISHYSKLCFLQWLPQVRTLCSIKIILFNLAQVGFAAGACQTWNNAKFLVLNPNFLSVLALQILIHCFWPFQTENGWYLSIWIHCLNKSKISLLLIWHERICISFFFFLLRTEVKFKCFEFNKHPCLKYLSFVDMGVIAV